LFGDGCGAVLIQAAEDGAPDALYGHKMASDGGGMRHLNAPFRGADGVKALQGGAAPSSAGSYDNLFMNGSEVFKFAVRSVPIVRFAAVSIQACSFKFTLVRSNSSLIVPQC
jgi:3-oxoacyl-[acyl-carrier-protein] synthase-3